MGDAPEWCDNAYRIFDPTRKNGTIDIPKEFIDTANYCASLAHKTNHSFVPNAEFVVFDHPRFGLVPCLLSTQDIDCHEEIFVHYGYELDDCPDWYYLLLYTMQYHLAFSCRRYFFRYEALWSAGDYPKPEAFKEWSITEDRKGIAK
jgi:hypothetical protein